MAREQMMCFITPGVPEVSSSVQRRIDRMCRAIGRIHFATLALLPAVPDRPDAPASLLLEVVVDEGVPTPELVGLMLLHGFGVLWRLYGAHWPGPRGASTHSKRDWLHAFLAQHANAAACGFVGNRDRDVAQVCGENAFFREAGAAFRSLPPDRVPDCAALGDEMTAWAREAGGAWTAELPRRSMWRHGNLPDGVRIVLLSVRLVVPLLALLVLLMGLGAIGLASVQGWSGVGFSAAGGAVSGDLRLPACLGALTAIGGLAALAIGLYAAFLLLLCAASTLRGPPFFPIAAAVLIGAVLLLATVALVAWMFALMRGVGCGLPSLRELASPDMPTVIALAAGTACVVGAGLQWGPGVIRRVAAALGERIAEADRPVALPDVPLHRVHPSLQACEAATARRTGHMISLTDIRDKAALRRVRFWLWAINLLGERVFTEGRLGNAGGIKFGHWHVIDGGRRLLFCSNFDGSFGGYLDGFIRGASQGVNLVWRNTELRPRTAARDDQPSVVTPRSFPPTRLQMFCGCKCEQAFKSYARDSMVPHLYRFEAYCLSNDDIVRATRLRVALQGRRSAVHDDQIARALES